MTRALVGSIERFSIHDGPGIRTTVFFKGCVLHCPWCHNPELVSREPEVAFYPDRCTGCGLCEATCPEGAARMDLPGRVDRRLCTACALCARECPARALELVGTTMEQETLLEILLRDRIFYEVSGGGVTLSGGEPTLQMEPITGLLQGLKREGIHTAIQTCGHFSWEDFSTGPLRYLDLVFFDVKIADPEEHRRVLGAGNHLIIQNLHRLARLHPRKEVVARIPLIPGYTATRENLSALSNMLEQAGIRRVALLPYHPFGLSKAENLGREPEPSLPRSALPTEELDRWSRLFAWADTEDKRCC